MIPPGVLEEGELAFVRVLRRRHPDAAFLPSDCPVRPQDPEVSGQVSRGAAGDLDPVEETGENVAALEGVETLPEDAEGAAGGQTGLVG